MTTFSELFDSAKLTEKIADLARRTKWPKEQDIKRAFKESTREVPALPCCKYPNVDPIQMFKDQQCDLKARNDTWVEIKHAISPCYLRASKTPDQGTTKDIVKSALMDIAKSNLINFSGNSVGCSLVTILHLEREDEDPEWSKRDSQLKSIARLYCVEFEVNHLPYDSLPASQLSIYFFGKMQNTDRSCKDEQHT
jgi:hypothetical protein